MNVNYDNINPSRHREWITAPQSAFILESSPSVPCCTASLSDWLVLSKPRPRHHSASWLVTKAPCLYSPARCCALIRELGERAVNMAVVAGSLAERRLGNWMVSHSCESSWTVYRFVTRVFSARSFRVTALDMAINESKWECNWT